MRNLIFVALGLSACRSHDPTHPAWDAEVGAFLGSDRIERMETATQVRALRVDGSYETERGSRALASGFPIDAEGPLLTDAQRDRFLDLARDADHYLFELAKGCEFMPGVALRFDGPAGRLEVLLCFSCDEWAFAVPTAEGELESWEIEDCDPARSALLALARELFPKDETLSGLR
ncbi:MAG: hypothetical protein H6831_16355 [Planctomycetes bacterium]|nr:hypothetical protein [Planctomycetota bacterium]